MRRIAITLAALIVLALGAGSCGDDDGAPARDGTAGSLTVMDAWARSPMENVAAVYFVVDNATEDDDRLVGVEVGDLAARGEVHETTIEGGQAQMHEVDGVDLAAGETRTFEPGGYHVMLMELSAPLEVGETIELVLVFERAGEVPIEAEVRAFVEGDDMDGDGMDGDDDAM